MREAVDGEINSWMSAPNTLISQFERVHQTRNRDETPGCMARRPAGIELTTGVFMRAGIPPSLSRRAQEGMACVTRQI